MALNINDILISAVIFAAAYILIILEKLDKAVIALSGASLMILFKILSQETAFREIDFNTIGLLISMMVIVAIIRRTGLFEYLAVKTVKLAKGKPVYILVLLSLITGVLSAVLDNVTTILFILPLTFGITRDLKLNALPFVISKILASNTGGTATLVGDPPNIMIGSSAGLTFMDFIKNNGGISFFLLFATTLLLAFVYRKGLTASAEDRQKILLVDEKKSITDVKLLIKSLSLLFIVILGFVLHGLLHYDSSTIAIAGAALLMLISGVKPEKVLKEVEWKTIFFFAGLFILVGGLKESGIIKLMAEAVLDFTRGNTSLTALAILWVSAIASAFIDNIPFVATMIPMIKDMGQLSGMDLSPLWWALSLGACLGGNGTLIGASANVIAAGISEEYGYKLTFGGFFKIAFPVMLSSISVSTVYLLLFYL